MFEGRSLIVSCSRLGFVFSDFHSAPVNKISAQLKTPKLACAVWLWLTHGLALPLVWLWWVMFTGTRGHRVKMPSALFPPSIISAALAGTLGCSECYYKSRWKTDSPQCCITQHVKTPPSQMNAFSPAILGLFHVFFQYCSPPADVRKWRWVIKSSVHLSFYQKVTLQILSNDRKALITAEPLRRARLEARARDHLHWLCHTLVIASRSLRINISSGTLIIFNHLLKRRPEWSIRLRLVLRRKGVGGGGGVISFLFSSSNCIDRHI